MKLRFWKMTAAGNDFVLVVAPRSRNLPRLARRLCDRRAGVGADGLLAVRRASGGVRLRYLNSDGSYAFCGNGARCAAWWAFCRGWSGRRMRLCTKRGEFAARVTGRERVALSLPDPRRLRMGLRVRALSRTFVAHGLDIGVPHAVIAVPGLAAFPVAAYGRAIRRHRSFGPGGTNVDFVSREGPGLRLRTYERGVEDETWACGTGAAAAAVAGWRLGWVRPPVRVRVLGGSLTVYFQVEGEEPREVQIEGPARAVFQGEVEL